MKSYNLLLGLTVTACALGAQAAQPAPVSDINQQPAYTSPDVEALQRMLATRNRALNDMQQQLEELQTEISELRGVTEEQAHTIDQILQRQRELYQEIDRRLAAAAAKPVANTNSNASTNVSYSNNLSENEAYDHAVNLVLKDKRYDQAITEFTAFNNKYPNSSYSANAHYWLGQLLFNKNDLKGAEKEFSIVINNFESSSKRSDAMLKLGMVAQKQNNNSKAKSIYNNLIKEYPGTSAAQLAKSRVASL
ncbi:tol-pal system protein YbgF [Thalassomonas sp. M1454]|uniref:tol-pal system protein YbgF n=1 Tax=Thalassomonas sp. M1454 TaxID=2594477 RepID=UPI00117F8258|nr:tol-pal system protein YbgF [Thalassomonas sp. M1454]TRX56375.1 tol-pal system protein YbgF [Thalassomonas sp. M1454]